MKNNILFPLILGLALAGCTRTTTDAQKLSANDSSADPGKPVYNAPADTGRKPAGDQAQAATAANPNPAAGKGPMADASASMAANSTPLTTPPAPTTTTIAPATATKSGADQPARTDLASSDETKAKPDLTARLAEWKLRPEDIKGELETSGRIVRSRTAGAGEPTGPMDSILIGQITSRLADNSSTSALKLSVGADKGVVTLKGSAPSLAEIGQAVALSLDTPGVTQTIAEVKLDQHP